MTNSMVFVKLIILPIGETLLSPIVMCGPHGMKFNIPIELRLPHCAMINPNSWSFALKSSNTNNGKWSIDELLGLFQNFSKNINSFEILFVDR